MHTDRVHRMAAEGDTAASLELLREARRRNDEPLVRQLVCRLAQAGVLHVYVDVSKMGRYKLFDRSSPRFGLEPLMGDFLMLPMAVLPQASTDPEGGPITLPPGSFELPPIWDSPERFSMQAGVVLEFCETALLPGIEPLWGTLDRQIVRECVAPLLRQVRSGRRLGSDWAYTANVWVHQDKHRSSRWVRTLLETAQAATTQGSNTNALINNFRDWLHNDRDLEGMGAMSDMGLSRQQVFSLVYGNKRKPQSLMCKLLCVGASGLDAVGGGWA